MPVTSPHRPVEIPGVSVYDLLFADLTPQDAARTAVTDSATGTSATFGELRDRVDAFAGALAHRGVGVGDVVALHAPNSLAFVIAFHGIMRAGATVTTVGALATAGDVARQVTVSGASLMLTVGLLGPAGAQGAEQAGLDTDRVIDLADGERGLASLLSEGHPAPQVDFDPATHVAVLPFSSGTTGVPKGVRLSHRNLVANIVQISPLLMDNGQTRDSVIMAVLPFFHIYGMNVLLNSSLHNRTHLVTMPSFDLPTFLELHQRHNIDFTFVAPPIAVVLAKHPLVDDYDISSLTTVLSGAAALDENLAAAVEKRLGVKVLQGFGMTEASPVTHVSSRGVTPLASIGLPVANTECKVVDLTDPDFSEILPPAQESGLSRPGEMWVRGPQVMLGYLDNEEATEVTLLRDGWLRTGDIVRYDHQGNVYVVDRAKELIKYKGYQVAPAELEALLMTHDSVADAAVVGFFRPEDGEEIPRAFVVPQVDASGTPVTVDGDALMEWVAARVAPYKKIRMVEVIDVIPKSGTGKILRKDLRDLPVTP
ncbi:MAG: AMP-binding protein [Corynebacterium provencense]|uniref:AMP-binding protein n=1 Tax=Corynebacterium provencense TaxID=1737425 RepID=UPI002989E41B|nr:AMP-binding protein [Corynebacterium provencense]